MPEPHFNKMRASLVDRGLICAAGKLTVAGNDYVDQLLDTLPRERCDHAVGAPLRWNVNRGGKRG